MSNKNDSPQLSVKEALEVARKNSTLSDHRSGFTFIDGLYSRYGERLHPTRNDIDRFGRPSRKKKGSLKPKKWLK